MTTNLKILPRLTLALSCSISLLSAQQQNKKAVPSDAKKYPSGSVKMYDHSLKREVPISGVEIIAVSNGQEYISYTDSLGNYGFPSLLGKNVAFRLVWQYKNRFFHIRSGALGKAGWQGPRNSMSWNPVFTGGDQGFYGTIFRAGSRYLSSDFVNSSNAFKNIAIKAYWNLKPFGKGSARHNALFETMQVWGLSKSGERLTDARLFSYVAHELGHAHHDHFYKGISQHLGTSLRLKESWSEAVRYFVTRTEYGDSIEETLIYSKQYPFYSGWRNFSWGHRKKYFYNYTPLMIDLVDTIDQDHVDDRVSGYTLSQIRSVMEEKSCRDFDSFKQLLKARYNNPTEQYLDILFKEMEGR